MIRYIIRRFIQAIPIFFGITVLSYLLMTLSPGGPIRTLYASDPRVSPAERHAIEARLGISDPLPVQYVRWLIGDDWMRWDSDGDGKADASVLIPLDADGDGINEPPGSSYGILRGDFGRSFFQRKPTLTVIREKILPTMELGLSSLIISILVGVPIGIVAAVRQGGVFDNVTRVIAVMFSAIPIFWLGLLLLLIFGSWLQFLPMGGQCDDLYILRNGQCPPIYERLRYILLPAIVLSTGGIAVISRYMRTSMLEVINQDYIRTAKAKGLKPNVVWFGHAARNALIPLATFLGPAITGVIGGAVVTERIFSWPGLGRLSLDAVGQKDYPIVMATVIITSIATIIGFIISDVLYAVIDPRIRFN